MTGVALRGVTEYRPVIAKEKDLLRFSTAGSVDDGKSTMIGRLLYDSRHVYEDQIASIKKASVNRSGGLIDFSLLTDGLRAEREQGITIDVAYRYFETARRKFIIADTPGHEQYTRNMATGASTSDLAVILTDARKGVLPQSRRHAFIAALLGIQQVVVAVNKMDLVAYSQDVFEEIQRDFQRFARDLRVPHVHFIPISALDGDNVVNRSRNMPWYEGPSMLEFLERVPITRHQAHEFRFPVQYVIRPSLDFRGYAGQIASGWIHVGDEVTVLPSGVKTRVKSIVTFDGELQAAHEPMSVTICLEDEVDLSRGDMLVRANELPLQSQHVEAAVVWMSSEPLHTKRPYIIKQTSRQVRGVVNQIHSRVDVNTLEHEDAEELSINEIGILTLETHHPLIFDAYRRNRATGSFIIIDPLTNITVGAGMIERSALRHRARRVTNQERRMRFGHQPYTVCLSMDRSEIAWALERALFDRHCLVHVLTEPPDTADLRLLHETGAIVICIVDDNTLPGLRFNSADLPADPEMAVERICAELAERGVFKLK